MGPATYSSPLATDANDVCADARKLLIGGGILLALGVAILAGFVLVRRRT